MTEPTSEQAPEVDEPVEGDQPDEQPGYEVDAAGTYQGPKP